MCAEFAGHPVNPEDVRRFEHGSRVPGWHEAVDLTKDPSAIPENAASYMKIPASTRSISVELTYQDGSLSEIKNFRR